MLDIIISPKPQSILRAFDTFALHIMLQYTVLNYTVHCGIQTFRLTHSVF